MRKVIPKNIADEMTRPYIDDAVDKQLKAADVPPRNKLDISFKDAGRTDDNKDYESNQDAYEKNHGKLYDMTHKNTIPWRNYVVYLVLLSLLTTVFTFSKYMSGANANSTSAVAKFNVVTSKSLNNSDFVAESTTREIVFEDGETTKDVYIKVTSNSEVSVKATITNTNYRGSFYVNDESVNVAEIEKGDNKTCTFKFVMVNPGATGTVQNGYHIKDPLLFNVSIEQIN